MKRPSFSFQTVRALCGHIRGAFWKNSASSFGNLRLTSSSPVEIDKSSTTRTYPSPFRFETGVALFAKRAPRPFPPPYLSPPSASFSDPLSTHNKSHVKRAFLNGQLVRGCTNGDDAVYFSSDLIAVSDGVGAWSTRPGGHAGLWSRLILHFWAQEIESSLNKARDVEETYMPSPITDLQTAYKQTIRATSEPNKWFGTTTVAGAQLYSKDVVKGSESRVTPLLYVTNLGDSQVFVFRPHNAKFIYKSIQQWHWFDCPRQLGTNSPDTPRNNATLDVIDIEEGDIVLAMSDGVTDNLWEHEIIENIVNSMKKWETIKETRLMRERFHGTDDYMKFVANELMIAAKIIATDLFAQSPFMEHAIEEGLAREGGKLDDISIVAAQCKSCR